VGRECTGKAQIKTHWIGGLGTWLHAEGVPHACTAIIT